MIILEGPDGSGKTSVIERLGCERRAFKALRAGVGGNEPGGTATSNFGGSTPAAIVYAQEILKAACERDQHWIAFDRFHLSEHVYGPMLRGKQELSEDDLHAISMFIGQYRIPIVLCMPPFEVTLQNVMTAGRDRPAYQTEEFLREAYQRFQRLTPWAHVVYDFTRDPFPNTFDIRRRPNRERH